MLSLEERECFVEKFPSPTSLSLSVRNMLLKEISDDVVNEQPSVDVIASRIRKDVSLFPMSKHEAFAKVAGVDAGSQILPLASRRYGLITALTYGLPSGFKYWMQPELMSIPYGVAEHRFKGIINVRREAKLYETAIAYLEKRPQTDFLLVDGPLIFSDLWSMVGCQKDQKRFMNAVNSLLRLCRDSGVTIAGLVKRTSARYFMYHLGLQIETQLPDSFLLLQALKPGERTDIFSPKSALQDAGRATAFMEAIDFPIYSFYGRMTRKWSIPPIRVDIPAYSLAHLNDIADYCYGTALDNGIPLALVKADEEVKITRRFMAEVYGEILSRVSKLTGEMRGLAPYWGEGRWMGT